MRPIPKDDHNMVNNITFRKRIIDAVQSDNSFGSVVDDLVVAEPTMMALISDFTNELFGTINDSRDVIFDSSDSYKIPQEIENNVQSNARLQKLLLWLFSIGFKTGGETMREFYKEALDGLIELPHEDYDKKDFE